jgi:hypothetical protein
MHLSSNHTAVSSSQHWEEDARQKNKMAKKEAIVVDWAKIEHGKT